MFHVATPNVCIVACAPLSLFLHWLRLLLNINCSFEVVVRNYALWCHINKLTKVGGVWTRLVVSTQLKSPFTGTVKTHSIVTTCASTLCSAHVHPLIIFRPLEPESPKISSEGKLSGNILVWPARLCRIRCFCSPLNFPSGNNWNNNWNNFLNYISVEGKKKQRKITFLKNATSAVAPEADLAGREKQFHQSCKVC